MKGIENNVDAKVETTALSGNSAEANAVKFEGNTINVGGGSESTPWLVRVADGFKRLRDPEAYERAEGRARLARVESDLDIYEAIRKRNPQLTPAQVALEGNGYRLFPGEAENVAAVIEDVVDADDGTGEPLSQEFTDSFVRNSANAYDEEARNLFVKAALGERDRPGSFSRRALSILGEMSASDVAKLERLCSLCIGGKGSDGSETDIIPYLMSDVGGFSFDGGAISRSDVVNLQSLGIVVAEGRVSNEVKEAVTIYIGGEPMHILRAPGAGSLLHVGELTLTLPGMELATLCPTGTAPGFRDLVRADIERQGFKVAGSVELAQALLRAMQDEAVGGAGDSRRS